MLGSIRSSMARENRMAETHLRLQPILEANEHDRGHAAPSRRRLSLRSVLIAIGLGLIVALAVKLALVNLRYSQAVGQIQISAVTEVQRQSALERQLGRLYVSSVDMPQQTGYRGITLASMISRGNLMIFTPDPHAIAIKANADTATTAEDIVRRIQAGAIGQFSRSQSDRASKARDAQQALVANNEKLQEQYNRLRGRLRQFRQQETDKTELDKAILTLVGKLEETLNGARQLNENLTTATEAMYRAEAELERPTINLDPAVVQKAAFADRQYAGDHRMLTVRHNIYIDALIDELDAAEVSLTLLEKHMKILSESVAKQLAIDLPDELADDLLELNLASQLYQSQLAGYRQRWNSYRKKIVEVVGDAEKADYDGVQTILSQCRQDLRQRCGELPERMLLLFNRLKSMPKSDARKPGRLSKATVRNIASSAVAYDIEQVIAAWQKLNWHIDHTFPETNMKMRPVAKFCLLLQTRMNGRKSRIKNALTEQYRTEARRRARQQLHELQEQFHQAGTKLTTFYDTAASDQQALCKLTGKWPKWHELNRQVTDAAARLNISKAQLSEAGIEVWPEELEAGRIEVVQLSHAGILGDYENRSSVAAGLLIALAFILWRRFA